MTAARKVPALRFATIGVAGGLFGGLLGVGGGFIMVPLLVLWTGVPQHRANGTSLLAIIPIAVVAASVYYFQAGQHQVDLGFALLLVMGSVVGVYLGARAMSRIPEAKLKVAIGVLLVIVGFKELLFP